MKPPAKLHQLGRRGNERKDGSQSQLTQFQKKSASVHVSPGGNTAHKGVMQQKSETTNEMPLIHRQHPQQLNNSSHLQTEVVHTEKSSPRIAPRMPQTTGLRDELLDVLKNS